MNKAYLEITMKVPAKDRMQKQENAKRWSMKLLFADQQLPILKNRQRV